MVFIIHATSVMRESLYPDWRKDEYLLDCFHDYVIVLSAEFVCAIHVGEDLTAPTVDPQTFVQISLLFK